LVDKLRKSKQDRMQIDQLRLETDHLSARIEEKSQSYNESIRRKELENELLARQLADL
jgi:hypothetical protein